MLKGKQNLTPQRRAVLEAVRESTEHPTAREILERARGKVPRLSYATVYNALDYLKRAGLVHEVSLGGGASRYDGRDPSHAHAICGECGSVVDIGDPDAAWTMRRLPPAAVAGVGAASEGKRAGTPAGAPHGGGAMGGAKQCHW